MTYLLADIGGTNARFALASGGAIDVQTIVKMRGDDHPYFDSAVRLFLEQQGRPDIQAVCVAVAGPVTGGRARLTNRDWDFTEGRLCDLTGASQARLINDMIALGYATPALGQGAFLRPAMRQGHTNGQRLVVNAGTGFNVCAVKVLPGGGIACLEAEQGHTRLPLTIAEALGNHLPHFPSVEELFAGRGLARLHAVLHGIQEIRAEQVVAESSQDARAAQTCDLYARLLGLLCRELALSFMPFEGMFLAGSVARSAAERIEIFDKAFLGDELMSQIPEQVPLGVIRDDMAALQGCLAALG